MKRAALTTLLFTLTLAVRSYCSTRVKLDSVPAEYRPNTGAEQVGPVSMQDFYFEVNKETARARVVVEYTYPGEVGYSSDGDPGPPPSITQLSGLIYEPFTRAVVYSENGQRIVCAIVKEKRGVLRGSGLSTRKTGSCVVTAAVEEHTRDDGWSLHHFRALDTYLEVH